MKTKRILPIIAVGLVTVVAGCSNSECYDNHSALPLASFYNVATFQQVSIQGLEIYGIGAPGDSILYTTQSLSQAYLPFRIWQDTTQYVFAYYGMVPDSIASAYPEVVPRDTLTFIYKPKEWFVSPACGAMYFYEMDTIKHSSLLIDSVSYKDIITNENISNIEIFFRQSLAN